MCPNHTFFCMVPGASLNASGFADTQIADDALARYRAAVAAGTERIFLAVGFRNPHLPWRFPEAASAFYPDPVPATTHRAAPGLDTPAMAWQWPVYAAKAYTDMRNVTHDAPLGEAALEAGTRAYYATITYTDYQIGRVLAAVREAGLEDDTLVVLVGDHGQNLGGVGGRGRGEGRRGRGGGDDLTLPPPQASTTRGAR